MFPPEAPKTGEIIGADIMLEFVHFTNRVFYDKLFVNASEAMDLETYEELQQSKGDPRKKFRKLARREILQY